MFALRIAVSCTDQLYNMRKLKGEERSDCRTKSQYKDWQ